MYTLTRVIEEFTDICNKAKVEVNVPIELNNRLSTTLGRVRFRRFGDYNYIAVTVQFSTKFITNATDEEIWNVIAHEAAHYIILERYNENHNHDQLFKEVCKEIGCSNDKARYQLSKETEDRLYKKDQSNTKVKSNVNAKYVIYCPHCGVVGVRQRMCKALKELEHYRCSKCDSNELYYKQN